MAINENGISKAREMLCDYVDEILQNVSKESFPGISTGFRSLDDLTGGFENGKVYVIGGRPAMGKEELMLSMIRSIVLDSKMGALLFVANHLKRDYMARLLSIHCGISTLRIKAQMMETWERKRQERKIGELMNAPLLISGGLDLKLDEMLEMARHCISEKGVKIVFVDCLQMVDYNSEGTCHSDRLAHVMYSLKELAREMNLPVVVGAMLSRYIEYREGLEGKRPVLMDLANSCYIEELADVVMMVHRPEYYHLYVNYDGKDLRGQMQVLVKKNALRPLGEVTFRYEQDTGAIIQLEPSGSEGSWRLEELKANNEAVESLINALNLEEETPF